MLASLNNGEMAYASNASRGGTGGLGRGASSSISVACNPPTTCSAQTSPGGGGSISCSDPSFLRCGGAFAAGTAGDNGAAGSSSGPNGAGGSGGSGGSASATSAAGGLLTSTAVPGGLGGAGGAPGPRH
jgi:hypothetical protein